MARELSTAILDGGIRNVNFFEGRLLSAADLRAEQEAQRSQNTRLGRAVGAGVVEGLQVRVESDGGDDRPPVVEVQPGLALNARGQTLELPTRELVSLVRSRDGDTPGPCLFRDCSRPVETQVPVGVGLYVLLLAPADGFQERAPRSGLGGEGRVAGCGSKWAVEGVRFRLERLDPSLLTGISQETRDLLNAELAGADTPERLSRLRNLAAHLCFGTEALARFAVDPFARQDGLGPLSRHGALDDLRAAGRLSDCEVPLALFFWTLRGIAFLDLWSVRRRPVPKVPSAVWPTLAGERTPAEAEAVLLQFQEHLESLILSHPAPALIRATACFRHLPPVGLLPVQAEGRTRGVTVPQFFHGRVVRGPVFTEGARAGALLARGLEMPPIDLAEPEMVWLYQLRENRQPAQGEAAPPAPPAVVFASGFLEFAGHARFDVSRWSYSNYSSLLVE